MAIKGEWITYGGGKGYFAAPERAAAPLPGIIVIQEAFGVNEHIEDVTKRFAAAGYAALAPDLFTVNGERPAPLSPERIGKAVRFMRQLPPGAMANPAIRDAEMAKLPDADRKQIGETYGQIFGGPERLPPYVARLREAFRHLRGAQPQTKGQKVACVGFCMGGGLSALLACEEPEISGAAVFYGATPPADKIHSIRCPVIGFYAGNDTRINPGIPVFEKAMRAAGKQYERFVYDGANHSFFNDDGPSYNVKAVRDAFVRLLAFFQKTLSD
ncbi:MAG TPA: dienelactone hydrolase family protein [Chitinivibrionales bacterium]|nr:dienelactone hydrolase family protein [Chitinivibrionales bacterium]